MDTKIETASDIRRFERTLSDTEAIAPEPGDDGTLPFRPLQRPPMAFVCALDDDQRSGVWHRITTESWTVGRTQGDLVLSHDLALSREHFRIALHGRDWYLEDLDSSNGTFVRIRSAPMASSSEALIGSTLLELKAAEIPAVDDVDPASTRVIRNNPPASAPAAELIVSRGKETTAWSLSPETTYRIGRADTECQVPIGDDPMVNRKHCELKLGKRGGWLLIDLNSTNGTWLRLDRLRLPESAEIQVGEQRFVVKIGSMFKAR